MKVIFKPEGGFGFFPGLNKPLELSCDNLPEPEAHHLQELLNDACFFDLPSQSPESSRGADQKHYTIQVEDNGQAHSVAFSDTDANAALQNLVSYLSKKQQESRSGL
ncbi:hypothetical protein I2I11_15530 [Pontibacter sp. 172403-2]|uniref:protealysin inhibitor emfourin n=1 Tax=Pontibacter rufus TaxID=2791028 RepID=UPI0018AF6935|nr:protealysin inhibitor emfourin [Pontibacter sp. 172403-2]MBF9254716.1 hypothetical protein [Pontibacter sp. 172403-2]